MRVARLQREHAALADAARAPAPARAPVDAPTAPRVDDAALASDLAAVDATLSMLANGDAAVLASCRAELVTSLTDSLASLERALTADDRRGLRFHAHTLKGTCLTTGLSSLAATAGRLESAAPDAAASALASDSALARAQLDRLTRALASPA